MTSRPASTTIDSEGAEEVGTCVFFCRGQCVVLVMRFDLLWDGMEFDYQGSNLSEVLSGGFLDLLG